MGYILVPDYLSHDTLEALEALLDETRARRIIGLGFVAMYRQRRFIANTAGECYTSPHFTRAMLLALDDKLAHQIGAHEQPP